MRTLTWQVPTRTLARHSTGGATQPPNPRSAVDCVNAERVLSHLPLEGMHNSRSEVGYMGAMAVSTVSATWGTSRGSHFLVSHDRRSRRRISCPKCAQGAHADPSSDLESRLR